MLKFIDQCSRELILNEFPKRIVSTVPSQTELLCDLGLEDRIVGITGYCVQPAHLLSEKTVIGGTKDLQIDKILSLKPDLIIANKEENIREQIEKLSAKIPVWISDVESLDQGLDLISKIGELTNSSEKAQEIVAQIGSTALNGNLKKAPKTLFFIWKEPYMLAGNSTFIGDVLKNLGLENIAPSNSQRYPQISFENLKDFDPDLILLSSEPYSFSTKEAYILAEIFPKALLKIVDGEMFSWYGSRMIHSMRYFKNIQNQLLLYFNEN